MENKKQASILSHISTSNSGGTISSTPQHIQKKTTHKMSAKSVGKDLSGSDRKSLKTIQLTPQEDALARGGTPVTGKSKSGMKPHRIHTCDKPFAIYEDQESQGSSAHAKTDESTQTDTEKCWCQCHADDIEKSGLTPEEYAELLMCKSEPPPEYWKELAEERREALSEALEENEQLHTSITELKEENRRLSEAGDKLAKFLLDVAGDENNTESEETRDSGVTEETDESNAENVPTADEG